MWETNGHSILFDPARIQHLERNYVMCKSQDLMFQVRTWNIKIALVL